MLHPVGSLPPSVYWRRRLTLLGVLVVLVVITVYVLRPGGGKGGSRAAADTNTLSPSPTFTGSPHTDAVARDTTAARQSSSAPASHAAAGSSSSSAPKPCDITSLKIAAVVGQPSYSVGQNPVLMMQVTNPGTTPCVQDLADSQVELRVYNGESRVWGSHDCQVQPGSSPVTLTAGQSVRVSITWSGLSSQPQCAGTRQRVGAGSYTLYALLAGREGTAASFALS
jgi:hypothetical protein